MRGVVVGLGLGLAAALGGCATTPSEPKVATAAEVPIRFAYGGLGTSDASYQRLTESRSGSSVRRAAYRGGAEYAVFDLLETLGDSYFTPQAPGAFIERFFKPDATGERGASGTVGGSRQTSWRAFRLKEPGAACVELQRSLREHVEGGINQYSQALVVGVYCRAGDGQIGADEANRIARGLSA